MLLNVVCALFFQNKALTKNAVPVEGSVSQKMDDRHKMVEQEEIQTPKASRFIHRVGHIKKLKLQSTLISFMHLLLFIRGQ